MRYEILSDSRVPSEDGDNATQYLFLEVPYNDAGKPFSEEVINNFCRDHFERRVNSPYDCSGQWFTCGINATVIDNDTWDNKLTVALIIGWGCDV